MKNLCILGSTGSIGANTLKVVKANPDLYKIVALAAGKNTGLLCDQILEFKPLLAAVKDENIAIKLGKMLPSDSRPEIVWGAEGYKKLAAGTDVEMVVSAMAGAAGLLPTLAAIDAGKAIALANKEIMVMAGDIVTKRSRQSGSRILPVDSEHSAIFQSLLGHRHEDVRRVILTASGGPFRKLTKEGLANVTPNQALSHPNWEMGAKITIDSASMMNKGLEVIEARWLFDLSYDQIHICIHPQSIVHSLVEFIDGSLLAQLGAADMRVPIAYALSFPERVASSTSNLDLISVGSLEFFAPDFDKFPNIRLAYEAGRQGATMPAVLNAANELAVEAFLARKIGFTDITKIIEETLSLHFIKNGDPTIEDILAADSWAREKSGELISNTSH